MEKQMNLTGLLSGSLILVGHDNGKTALMNDVALTYKINVPLHLFACVYVLITPQGMLLEYRSL